MEAIILQKANPESSDAQIFRKSMSHLKILGARKVIWN